MQMRRYFLHIGPTILPRHGNGPPMTLAQALHRAYGQRYAVVYRLGDHCEPIPVVADAGNHEEVLHVPSGRRVPRAEITRHKQLDELDLAGKPGPNVVVTLIFDPANPATPLDQARLASLLEAAGYGVRVRGPRNSCP